MKTVLLGPPPAEVEAFLARRRELGQDPFDEVWEGTYHVAPASHPWHGYIDNVLAELLGPLRPRARLLRAEQGLRSARAAHRLDGGQLTLRNPAMACGVIGREPLGERDA